jgi:hypothetical protein
MRDSIKVSMPSIASISATPKVDSLCVGKSSQLNTTINRICGTNSSTCGSTISSAALGANSYATSSDYITPFGGYPSSKKQMLITKAELNAIGISGSTTFTSFGFNFSIGTSSAYSNFTAKMGCTALTNLTYTYQTGLQTVINPKLVTVATGVNYYAFDNTYDWDGTSNIIIEICYDNNGLYAINPTVIYSSTAFTSVDYSYSSIGVCAQTSGSLTSSRPNLYFKTCSSSGSLSYAWTPSATLSNAGIANPIATPSSTTTYQVNMTDAASGCIFKDSVKINVSADFTLTNSGTAPKCSPTGVGIKVTPSPAGTYTYSWTPSSTLTGANTSNPTANPTSTTTYFVKVVSGSCIKRDSVKVTMPAVSSVMITPRVDSLCTGQSTQLNTIVTKLCGTNGSNCASASTSGPAGSGINISSNDYITPYGYYPSSKKQLLFTKAELNALGITGPSTITQLGFNVYSGAATYQNYTIKMGCTALQNLSYIYATGLQTVFNPKTITTTGGINYYAFDNSYDWDGVSNLIVELCYDNNGAYANYISVYYTSTAFTSVAYGYGTAQCGNTSGNTYSYRPNTYFKYCSANGSYTYVWSPSAGLSNTTISNPVATPSSTGYYKLTFTDNTSSCIFKDSVKINVGAPFVIDAGRDSTICKNNSVTLKGSVPAGSYTIQWSPSTGLSNSSVINPVATPMATTTYKLIVKSASGCTQKDSAKITLSGTAPVVTATASKTLVCLGTAVQLNVSAPGTSCGTFSSTCSSPLTGQIGNGSGTDWSEATSPYHGYHNSSKRQFIFTKTELNAMGMTSGVISQIGFNVSGSMGYSYQGFNIKMGCTSATDFYSGNFATGLQTVYNARTITPFSGVNYYVFDNNYDWDGSSNIVIELCFNNPTYPGYSQYVTYISTTSPQVIYTSGTSVCANTTGTYTFSRPNVYFGYCASSNPSGITYSWSPATGLSNPNIINPVATVSKTTLYTVTATSGSCKTISTIKVAADSSLSLKTFMDTTCTNGPVNLHTIATGTPKPVTLTCGPSAYSACGSPSAYTVGTGSSTSYNYGPFYQNYSDFKGQYLITAADLTAAGMSSGIITKLNFNITNKFSTIPYSGFTVKLGCTAATNLSTAGWLTTSLVYGPQNYTTVTGLNTVTLSTPYNWDGTSNLVVEICWDNSSYSSVDYMAYTNTSYISTMLANGYSGSGCTYSPSYTYYSRPNISFSICPPPPGSFTYSWSPATALSNATIANPIASPASNTMYKVTVNGGNCVVKDSVLAIPNQAVALIVPAVACKNDSVQLSATGGSQYTWTPSTGLSNAGIAAPKAYPSVNTTYTVNAINALGCKKKDSVTVYIWNINPAKGLDQAICKGDSAQINVSGAGSYSWSPATGLSDASSAAPKASPPSTTVYKITYISSDGHCTAKDSVKVNVNNYPVLSLTPSTAICKGDTLQISVSGADVYQWSPATDLSSITIANPKASPLTTIQYVLTASTTFGCTKKDSLVVSVVNKPVLSITSDTMICKGQNLRLIVSGAQNYTWSPSAPNNDTIMVSPAADTRYRVVGSFASGCNSKDSMMVTVHAAALATLNNRNQDLCKGDSAQLSASGAFNYSWSPATGLSNALSASPKASPAISQKYILSFTTSDSYCSGKDSVQITVHDKPFITINNDTAICAGSLLLHANVGAGTTVNWFPGNFTGNSYPVTANASTKYFATASDQFCQSMDSVMITVFQLPVPVLNAPATICKGDSISLNASGGVLYSWSPSAGLSNPAVFNPKAAPQAPVFYKVMVTNSNNCSATDSVMITVINRVALSISADKLNLCKGDLVNLSASGAQNYLWVPVAGMSDPASTNPSAVVSQNTTFTVYGSNYCSTDSAKISITANDNPVATPKQDTAICKGVKVQLSVPFDPTYTYSWNHSADLNNASINNPVATVSSSTDYIVTVTKGICSVQDTSSVFVASDQICSIAPSSLTGDAPFTVTFHNNGTKPASFQWIFGDGDTSVLSNPTHVYNKAGEYLVTLKITDATGCYSINTITITASDFFIPNLITPNGDGKNDRFKISSYASRWDLVVYNSWGAKVYEKESYRDEWDGAGEVDGVYYYHILDRETKKEYTGWVQIFNGK